ncbi:MAG: N-acetylmuramoyl-L-alanine amidase [Pikeienuella sp.]
MAINLSPSSASAEEKAALTIRLTQNGDINRIELGMTFRAGFKISTLTTPNRIVVDFPEIDWRIAAPRPGASIKYVDGVRFGLVRPGASRMVIDLRAPARVLHAFTEETRSDLPPRFVIELTGEEQSVFDARAAKERERVVRGDPQQKWPPSPSPRPKQGVVIAIDPGHGGIDPGAVHGDVNEKDLVLSYAQDIAAAISAVEGMHAVLTRTDDTFLTLRERVEFARRAGADAMISLHADALEQGVATGATVFTLSKEASDVEAEELASGNNRADVIGGVRFDDAADDVALVLIDFARRATDAASKDLAAELVRELEVQSVTLEGRALQSAGFRVLKAPDTPSALIELGFLSSARDRNRLLSIEGRKGLVAAIKTGIVKWAMRQKGEHFDVVRRANGE